ncbi:hypothetical protein KVF89_22580 [Nocardioides carbamazepini]|uniref:hypothetical protein n=1 Tax=Nocardioides carbamazepini TaxID=2854259 RepID=UPI00214A0D22|nr:hypothetical protein [Nocardioides carbamazepini]MCR1785344.1 hypothetical protein [Nocardioides carbamazepini]
MDFIQVQTNYYLEAQLVAAGEKAEVLFLRAKAYCADVENDGFVPEGMLPRLTPSQPTQRANALVRENLWANVEGGRRFVVWDQLTKAELEERRSGAAERQRRSRATRRKVTPDVTRDTPRDSRASHRTEVEEEVEPAAAAAGTELPPPLEILRSALEARKLVVRWDGLTADQITEIEQLITEHGDSPLVAQALRDFQPNKPIRFAQGWLSGWRNLRKPGDLAAVPDEPCPKPGHAYAGGTTRRCTACVAEAHTDPKEGHS